MKTSAIVTLLVSCFDVLYRKMFAERTARSTSWCTVHSAQVVRDCQGGLLLLKCVLWFRLPANKRKLFEKAQLKRRYAKLLKKEAGDGKEGGGARQSDEPSGEDNPPGGVTGSSNRKQGEWTKAGKARHKHTPSEKNDDHERQEDAMEDGQQQEGQQHSETGKRRRPAHRPDPFKAAKATADRRRQEAEEKQRKRDMQVAEKEGRAKKRRKQHAMLSQRTRGGQPVMKNTMRHLLEKIQSQS
ncbi:unnamed protein product [Scytosiphon promiscuus]